MVDAVHMLWNYELGLTLYICNGSDLPNLRQSGR